MKPKKNKVIRIEVLKEIVFGDMHPKHQVITQFNGDGDIVILPGKIKLHEKRDPRGGKAKIWVLPGTFTGMNKSFFKLVEGIGDLIILSK